MIGTLLAQTYNSSGGFSVVYVIPGMIVGGIIGALIGMTKGRTGLGFVLGALLGCIGWIIIAVMRGDRR